MPDWKKLFRKLVEIGKVGVEEDFIPPRCYICGKGMRRLAPHEARILKWRYPENPIYQCPLGHEFSPGNYAEGVNPPPPGEDAGPDGGV